MRPRKRITENIETEAERALDCLWGRKESSVATAHCASEDFYDMGVGGGRNQTFHLVCFSVGEKRNHIQTSRQGLCKTVHRSERIKDSKKSTRVA